MKTYCKAGRVILCKSRFTDRLSLYIESFQAIYVVFLFCFAFVFCFFFCCCLFVCFLNIPSKYNLNFENNWKTRNKYFDMNITLGGGRPVIYLQVWLRSETTPACGHSEQSGTWIQALCAAPKPLGHTASKRFADRHTYNLLTKDVLSFHICKTDRTPKQV